MAHEMLHLKKWCNTRIESNFEADQLDNISDILLKSMKYEEHLAK